MSNQPTVKDLQDADEFIRAISPGTEGFAADLKRDSRLYKFVCNVMARYAAKLIQQAKDAAFIEGAEAFKSKVIEWCENDYGMKNNIHSMSLPPSPYTTGEKGGEGE